MGNVVDVDFTLKREPAALANDLLGEINEIRSALGSLKEEEIWRGRIHRQWQRRRIADLRRQLEQERVANEPSDEEVLESLAKLGSVVSATQVAAPLYRNRPTHSAIVRCGQRLSRLASTGRVRRVRVAMHGEERNRWEAINV
jgi:hypothetical protein